MAKVRGALNVRVPGCRPPRVLFTDRCRGFYNAGTGKITDDRMWTVEVANKTPIGVKVMHSMIKALALDKALRDPMRLGQNYWLGRWRIEVHMRREKGDG